jgi:hypothetical protein
VTRCRSYEWGVVLRIVRHSSIWIQLWLWLGCESRDSGWKRREWVVWRRHEEDRSLRGDLKRDQVPVDPLTKLAFNVVRHEAVWQSMTSTKVLVLLWERRA